MSHEAVEGVLLGTAVGDALGLPYENLAPGRAARLLGPPDRHRFFFGRGMVSDDTEHACLTAEALAASAGEPERFERELARGMRWWLVGLPAGLGWATMRACVRLWCGYPPARSGVPSAGNGPAMRAAVLGAAIDDRARRIATVRLATRVTHTDPRAEVGAQAVALAAHIACRASGEPRLAFESALEDLLASLADAATAPPPTPLARSPQTESGVPASGAPDAANLACTTTSHEPNTVGSPLGSAAAEDARRSGESRKESARRDRLVPMLPAIDEFRARYAAVRRSLDAGETTPEFARGFCRGPGVSGYIYETVPVALHAWLRHPTDFGAGVTATISAGGDADTTAAIVGGLIGAGTGPAGIPEPLVRGLSESRRPRTYFRRLAECVWSSRSTGLPAEPPRISCVNLWPRNLLFLSIVVGHALRRLLPPYGGSARPASVTKPRETPIESPPPTL